jgi:hypothetical protein
VGKTQQFIAGFVDAAAGHEEDVSVWNCPPSSSQHPPFPHGLSLMSTARSTLWLGTEIFSMECERQNAPND